MRTFGLVLLFVTCGVLRAQDDEILDELLVDAATQYRTGLYDELGRTLNDVLAEYPEAPRVLAWQVRLDLVRGRHAEALAVADRALAKASRNVELLILRGEAAMAMGRYEEALPHLEQAAELEPGALRSVRLLGDALLELGRRDEARKAWERALRHATRVVVRGGEALYELGKCFERTWRFRQASECYVDGTAQSPELPDNYAALGNLYRITYNDAPGTPNPRVELEKALEINPVHPEANLALYHLYGDNYQRDQEKRQRWLQNLQRVNPRQVDLLLRETQDLLQLRRFEAAEQKVQSAAAVNPARREVRSYQYVMARLNGDDAGAVAIERELLAQDPAYGELYEIWGRALVNLYRFADAVPVLRKAVELDPRLVDANIRLGHALANVGDHVAALEALEASKAALPGVVHPWRENMITVLSALDREYVKREHAPFVFYLHPDGRPVLEEYLVPLYRRAYVELAKKYAVTPPDPVIVQYYREWNDFSARTIGFTGFGALGVCFGNTIAAVSPLAPEFRGKTSWYSTAWHEFAHTITLTLSAGRVPRWLTEGISTYEEKLLHPGFDRHLELELVDAYANKEVYPVELLNGAFRGARIIFGYYQGGLICTYLANEFSFDRIIQMVKMYGEDRPTREIFRTCFGIEPEEFDRRFLEHVKGLIEPIKVVPNLKGEALTLLQERATDDANDLEAAEMLAWQSYRRGAAVDAELLLNRVLQKDQGFARAWLLRGRILRGKRRMDLARDAFEKGFALGGEEFFSRLAYAEMLQEDDDVDGAIAQLRLAALAFPTFADARRSPHVQLAAIFEERGELEAMASELERYCMIDAHAFDVRMRLSEYLESQGQLDRAEVYYAEANRVDPFSRELHVRWGEALRGLGRLEEARVEFETARAILPRLDRAFDPRAGDPSEEEEAAFRAETLAREARVLFEAGERERAATLVDRALEVDPEQSIAQEVRAALGGK
ncbi:MAG: tetratricopeptide repeat protein [Planctomycetes bacterium]|nr:tetratricopeptide repeat protein [Planctomycetota bacterium]